MKQGSFLINVGRAATIQESRSMTPLHLGVLEASELMSGGVMNLVGHFQSDGDLGLISSDCRT
ncbi:hypothetical protein [Mesorhizobium sp.]|uniref:hypothetical protein n=1 Tax=Mesorhizobium sp. TaxID=1871066 RepID=UPI00338FC7E0